MKHLIKPDRISYFGPLPRVDNYLVQINSEVWIVNNIDYPLETCLNHSDAGLWSFYSHLAFPTSSPMKTKNVCEYDFKSDRKSLLRALFTVMFRTCIYSSSLYLHWQQIEILFNSCPCYILQMCLTILSLVLHGLYSDTFIYMCPTCLPGVQATYVELSKQKYLT